MGRTPTRRPPFEPPVQDVVGPFLGIVRQSSLRTRPSADACARHPLQCRWRGFARGPTVRSDAVQAATSRCRPTRSLDTSRTPPHRAAAAPTTPGPHPKSRTRSTTGALWWLIQSCTRSRCRPAVDNKCRALSPAIHSPLNPPAARLCTYTRKFSRPFEARGTAVPRPPCTASTHRATSVVESRSWRPCAARSYPETVSEPVGFSTSDRAMLFARTLRAGSRGAAPPGRPLGAR